MWGGDSHQRQLTFQTFLHPLKNHKIVKELSHHHYGSCSYFGVILIAIFSSCIKPKTAQKTGRLWGFHLEGKFSTFYSTSASSVALYISHQDFQEIKSGHICGIYIEHEADTFLNSFSSLCAKLLANHNHTQREWQLRNR